MGNALINGENPKTLMKWGESTDSDRNIYKNLKWNSTPDRFKKCTISKL